MKKRIVTLLCVGFLAFGLTGCGEKAEKTYLQQEIARLSAEKTELENSVATLKKMETAEKERTNTATYIVVLNISQSHFTLDWEEHLKDSMNDLDIPIPVSKEFYDTVEKGTVIDDSFRMGSFIFKGSIGSWDVIVSDKYVE